MARQDYFAHFEPSQWLGGAKTGDIREKTPNHLQAEPKLGSNPQWWDNERFRALKMGALTTRPQGPP